MTVGADPEERGRLLIKILSTNGSDICEKLRLGNRPAVSHATQLSIGFVVIPISIEECGYGHHPDINQQMSELGKAHHRGDWILMKASA